MTDYLYHHGILGMRWGVRRFQNKDGSYTAAGKKRYNREETASDDDPKTIRDLRDDHSRSQQNYEKELAEHNKFRLTPEEKKTFKKVVVGTAAVVGVGAAIYFGYKYASVQKMKKLMAQGGMKPQGTITPKTAQSVMLQTLADGDQVLKQGDVVHRMSAYANIDFSTASKPLYTSFRDEDVASYMTLLKDWSGTGKRYDVTLRAVKDLRIPSEQKARKIFDDLWNSDPTYRQKLESTVVDAYVKLGVSQADALSRVKADLKSDPFSVAVYSIVKNKEDTTTFVGRLRDAGYDALIDYFDKGVMAKQPLIVLDPSGSLQKVGERLATRQVKIDTLLELSAKGITTLPGTGYSVAAVISWILAGLM